MDLSRSEVLDKAEAALACYDEGAEPRSADAYRLGFALRALASEHRRVLAELDEAHAHFQVQEARIREARQVDDATTGKAVRAYRDARNAHGHMNSAIHFECMRAALLAALTPDGQEKNR